ncbi:acyl carrier protein phosphodiesterase [Alteromonas halophila]|uniref:ACP phosphodiesterase n=1 Tax=Alteromonas halophila TaxID=516698 RepID=A0A918N0W1_9ALTE|nr:ACP phosphodiesterase [Alteromonas halophila]GGW95209.1 ACP phosphodiesterase [Alteromonas halophila]
MNYLAHLFLARQSPDSQFGNLLGDFRRGADLSLYSKEVLHGLDNHYLVDRFTDSHPEVKAAKACFESSRRRFAPVALDVLFDHFLIRHWHTFAEDDFADFRARSYRMLESKLDTMPTRMQQVVTRMTANDGLAGYRDLSGVAGALHFLAGRIRFANQFEHSIRDIETHYDTLENVFLSFFPDLLSQVITEDREAGRFAYRGAAEG